MLPALLIISLPPIFNAPLATVKSPLTTDTILLAILASEVPPLIVTLNIGVSFSFLISNALLSLASKTNELL